MCLKPLPGRPSVKNETESQIQEKTATTSIRMSNEFSRPRTLNRHKLLHANVHIRIIPNESAISIAVILTVCDIQYNLSVLNKPVQRLVSAFVNI